MPPAKRTTKKTAKKTAKRAAKNRTARKATKKKAPARKMSAAHKTALAEGRRMSSTVDVYLRALNTPKKRGRQVSAEALRKRLTDAQTRSRTSTGIDRVLAAQEVRDLRARLASPSGNNVDMKALETAFARVAKKFSAARGVTYGAWRDAGVPADVLKRAGITRTRG